MHVVAPGEHCTKQSSIKKEKEGKGIGRTACLREKEEAALQEPGPDPVPEGGEPGQQAVLQARRQDVAVVTRESAPALCRGAARNFNYFKSNIVHLPASMLGVYVNRFYPRIQGVQSRYQTLLYLSSCKIQSCSLTGKQNLWINSFSDFLLFYVVPDPDPDPLALVMDLLASKTLRKGPYKS
jgi:hypothetical protein